MGFQGQAGRVGFKTQSVKGTYADPALGGGIYMRTRSGSLSGSRDLLIPDPEIGGNRDVPDAYLGPIAYAGEYDFYARIESLSVLLKGALGAPSTDAGPTAYTHTFTPVDTALPWISVEEVIADGYEQTRYTDCKVNTLHVEADANGYLMGTVGLIGLHAQAVPGASVVPNASVDYDTSPMVVGSNIAVVYNAIALPGKSFSFDINNNLEDDDFRLGSLELGDAVEKRREFTFGATIRPNNKDLYRQAIYGSAAATGPSGAPTKAALAITANTYEFITGSITSQFTVNIPQAIIRPFEVTPSGDDVVEHDVEIQGFRPNPAVALATFTTRNALATIP